MNSDSRLTACLVALNAGPAITPHIAGRIGGLETRAWQFARGLSRRGVDAQFVVRLPRRPVEECVDGVQVIPLLDRLYPIREAARMCVGKRRGFPWIEMHRWRPQLLWQLPLLAVERVIQGGPTDPWRPDERLRSLKTDVYCTFGVQSHSATVLASARAAGRPCVLVLGSDGDLDERYTRESTFISPYGDAGHVCWRILQEADAIVAQTTAQAGMLRERFGREATVIRNPVDVAEWDARRMPAASVDECAGLERFVLWVGRAESVHKRPLVCLDVARRCPELQFLMIMNPRDPQVEASVRREAPPNVRILSAVPFARMPAVFARASAFVNTSSLEGFPNVFLQAAISRVPIAALEVGAEFLQHIGCGDYANGNLAALCDALRRFWREGAGPGQLEAARETVIREHGLAETTAALAGVLAGVKERRQ
ncbi:MAG: glycosyltransferase family 4 protein [Planctomycetaceae bacterium]|nr:glycosyltransferase family 4 protein [Planctomycetaceae bacterium]